MTNVYLRWLGILAIVLPSFAAVMWLIAVAREQEEFGAGAAGVEIAGWFLQNGVIAALVWLLGRAIVAHLDASRGEPAGQATNAPAPAAGP